MKRPIDELLIITRHLLYPSVYNLLHKKKKTFGFSFLLKLIIFVNRSKASEFVSER